MMVLDTMRSLVRGETHSPMGASFMPSDLLAVIFAFCNIL